MPGTPPRPHWRSFSEAVHWRTTTTATAPPSCLSINRSAPPATWRTRPACCPAVLAAPDVEPVAAFRHRRVDRTCANQATRKLAGEQCRDAACAGVAGRRPHHPKCLIHREHRKVSEAVWNRPSVKGPANCAACHTRADQGDYDEHAVPLARRVLVSVSFPQAPA
jgi:hypothetical protein